MAVNTQRRAQRGSALVPWLLVAVLSVLAGAIAYFAYLAWQAEHALVAQSQAAADAARARTEETERARVELEGKLQALQQQHTALVDEKAKLSTERDQLTQTVQEKEAELARLKATYEDIEQKLKAEIQDGEIRLSQAEGRIQVDLVDKILFDSGEASLSPRGAEVLSRLGGVLAKVEDRAIQVSGHTDDSPPSPRLAATFPTNWELSVARAVNVVRFLQEKTSVPSRRLVAAGYGDAQPVASNASPKGRARNRRIEILLMPPLPAAKKAAITEAKTP
jgi:chemotaxis protein MotB